MNHYGDKIKAHREKRGLDPSEVALFLGVPKKQVIDAEATGLFSVAWMPRLAVLFRVPVTTLASLSGRPQKKKVLKAAAKAVVPTKAKVVTVPTVTKKRPKAQAPAAADMNAAPMQ